MNVQRDLPDTMTTDPRELTDLGDFVDSMVASAKGTIRTERDHIAFMVSRRVAESTGKMVGSLGAVALYGLAVLIGSLAAAVWLGRTLGDLVLGLAIVAGFYLVLGIIFGFLWKGPMGKRYILGLINSFHGH